MKKNKHADKNLAAATTNPTGTTDGAAAVTAAVKEVANGGNFKNDPFANLGQKLAELKLSVPTFDAAILAKLEGTAGSVEGKMQAVGKVQEGVANALKLLHSARKQYVAYATDRLRLRFAKEELAAAEEKANNYLTQVLQLKGALRSVAATSYITTSLTMEYASAEEVRAMLNELVDRGLLVSGGAGPVIIIGYGHYHIGEFGFEKEDITKISKVANELSRIVKTMERERRDAMNKEMVTESTITLNQALAGQNGTCLVHVPAESYTDREGATKWRGGGDIFFEFGKTHIIPIRASGSVESLVHDIAQRDARLPRHSLTWKSAPGHFAIVGSILRNDREITEPQADRLAKDVLTLWHMLRRGIKHAEEIKRIEADRVTMEKKSTITAEQFFGLNGTEGQSVNGTVMLQFDGVIKSRDGQKIFNPFLLVTRGTEEGGGAFIEVVEVPPHLQLAFGSFAGKRFPADNHQICPEVSDLLGKIRGQREMVAATTNVAATTAK